MTSILSSFQTETIILHKTTNDTFEVTGVFGKDSIMSDNVSIPIEEGDYFERTLPNGLIEYYLVTDSGFHKGIGSISDYFQTKVKRIKKPPVLGQIEPKQRMILISHSSKDRCFAKAFAELLYDIGLNDDDIVCTSYPGLGVPLGKNIYDWLVKHFQEYSLHVFFLLSHNYYRSAASLNEMGAAWVLKQKWDALLLPGFDFSDISGCIDSAQIGIKLDGEIEELKHYLGELKDNLIEEFELRAISATRWEKIRDSFIGNIGELSRNSSKMITSDIDKDKYIKNNQPEFAINISAINKQLPGTAIIRSRNLSTVITHKNVQLSIEIINDRYARNVIVFEKVITTVMKPGEKYHLAIAYEDSDDAVKWPNSVIKILHSEYEDTNGLPNSFNICYQDENGNEMTQTVKLVCFAEDQYYTPEGEPWKP